MKQKTLIVLFLTILLGIFSSIQAAVIFTEGFETGNTAGAVPVGWTADASGWFARTGSQTYGRASHTGDWYCDLYYGKTKWMFKEVSLTAGTAYSLSLWAKQDATSGASITLKYGATATSAGMTNTILAATNVSNSWLNISGTFTPSSTGTYYIGILGITNYTPYYVWIDDVLLESLTNPPNPAINFDPAHLATNVPRNKTLSWQSGGGGATNYYLSLGTVSPYSVIENGTDMGTSTTYTPSPVFEPNTEYFWKVVPHNSNGDAEGCEEYTFTTGTGWQYVVSTATNTADDDIGQFVLGGFSNPESAPTPLTYNSSSNKLYTDFTGLGSIDLQKGVQTSVSITQINSGSYYTCYAKVFIDYNQNGTFDLPDELAFVGSTSPSYGGSNPLIGSITAPLTAQLGTTRLRVVLMETTSATNVLPTGTYTYGETEDYTVNITAPPTLLPPSGLSVTNIGSDSATLGWTDNNTPPATTWDVIYGAPGFNVETEGTLVSSITDNPYDLTGLDAATSYSWYVRAYGETKSGKMPPTSSWAGPNTFSTTQVIATLPYGEDFETWPHGWNVLNGTQTNQWYVGAATFNEGAQSAYISNDGGTSNAYNTGTTSNVHMYRDIQFTAASQKFDLSFWWKGQGEGTAYDRLRVYLVDTTVYPVAGTEFATGQIGLTNYNLQADWGQANIELPGTLSGLTKRLVFSWKNDGSDGTQPPIAIDDIVITATPLPLDPTFVVNPTTKDFGAVQINTTQNQVFTISNTAGGTINLANVEINDPFYSITVAPTDMSLTAGESTNFTLQYAPTVEGGPFEGTVTISYSMTSGKATLPFEEEIQVTGTCVDPTIKTFPYAEGFNAATFPPLGWSNYSVMKADGTVNPTGYWTRKTTGTYNSTAGAAFINYSYSALAWACLQLPLVNIPANHGLTFYWRDNDSKVAGADTTFVEISIDNGLAWTVLAELSPVSTQSTYQKVALSLNSYVGDGRLIRFRDGTNATGSAWGTFVDELLIDEYFDYPEGEAIVVGDETITITGGSANNTTGDIPPVNNGIFVAASSFVLNLVGTGPWTVTIETTALWGAYYQGGEWHPVENVGGFITFEITAAKDLETPIVLGDEDPTLPVELSSFTATITSDLMVKIAWIAQSETNHSGYNILRAELRDLETAIKINPNLIDQGENLGTQISYAYTDNEAYSNMNYYYWLESVALDGVSEYFGPLSVTIGDPNLDPLPPVVPLATKLMNAFPNPFNPNTNVRYSLKEAGKVRIDIYNVKGQLVRSFNAEHNSPGYYQISWDGKDTNGRSAASGIYMYRMTSGKYSSSKKMILAK